MVVEGEWKNFVFKMAQPQDYPQILNFLREYFYPDEPLGRVLGLTRGPDSMKDLDDFVLGSLKQNISFYAQDKESGKLAGVRISSIVHKGDPHDDDMGNMSRDSQIIISYLDKLGSSVDVFEKYGIDKYGYLLMTAVSTEYRGQGLVTELYNRVLAQFRSLDVQYAKCLFTSPYTRKAANKLGFTELARIQFSDHKDQDGNDLLPNATENDFGALMVLKI